ncbi:T-cell surface glycoprotein CD4-like [Brachyistius frenatus]|uniref:T-cell surface glycoprotein CD4-like n=1 Tax=Brachyistius frenatus TaxID=100188 RepID=UPI0037E9662B
MNLIQSIFVLIAVLMSKSGAEKVMYAQVGDTVTFTAPEKNSSLKYYIYWNFDGEGRSTQLAWLNHLGGKRIIPNEPWQISLSFSTDSLTITNIQEENFGTFVFKLTVDDVVVTTTKYELVKLNVSMTPDSPLLPGDILSLACIVSQKKPTIEWFNPKGEVKKKGGTISMTATNQDNGQWTCVVTDDKQTHNTSINVKVVDLSPAPLHQYTSTYSPLTVLCSIPSDISWKQIKEKDIQEVQWHFLPEPSSKLISDDQQRLFSLSLEDPLTWKADQNRDLSPVPDLAKGNLSLTRNRGKEDDRGSYMCTLKFKNDVTLRRTVHVEVLQIISSPKELISGQRVNLSCTTSGPLPSDVHFKWFPPEKSSLQRSSHHPAHLTIPEVSAGDGGRWRCELWQKDILLTWAMTVLKIEPKLSVWMLVIICSAAVILILLLILTFILCRRRQQRTRHLRPRLCRCKNPKPKGFYRT